MYCHRSMRVVGAGFVLYCTWRVEYTAELHRPAVVCRIAGVSDRLRVTLRLRKRKHDLIYIILVILLEKLTLKIHQYS